MSFPIKFSIIIDIKYIMSITDEITSTVKFKCSNIS